jgi:phosphate-selective porin OprO/OprP
MKSADGRHVLKFRGYLQTDSRFYMDDATDPSLNNFLLRRVRPVLEGTLSRMFDFRFMPDFAGSTLVLQEAYIDARFLPEVRLRAGKFKPPVGLERLQSGTSLLLVERGLPTNLVPNRDVGIQIHGTLLGGGLNYAVAVFNGVSDGRSADTDIHDNKDYVARIFVLPFTTAGIPALEGLGIGIAATTGNEHGTTSTPALPAYASPGQLVMFRYLSDGSTEGTVVANGARTRLNPQTYYSLGPLGFLGEYVVTKHEVQKGAMRASLQHTAFQTTASYVLTGEQASYSGVLPASPFDLDEGTMGAVEIVVRFQHMDLDDAAFPTFANPGASVTEATGLSAGINWYLTRNLKLAVDYNRTGFQGGASGGGDRSPEKAVFTRLQVSF